MSTKPMQANTKLHYEVSHKDLPLSCPTAAMRVWDSHPRVFLAIEETGTAVCPYCEAEFILIDHPTQKSE